MVDAKPWQPVKVGDFFQMAELCMKHSAAGQVLIGFSYVLLAVQQVQAVETSGTQIAADLRALYYDVPNNCWSSTGPGFLCSGLILRATIPSIEYKSWAPSPQSLTSGGFSFSYLRKDAKFKKLVRTENNGFIIFPPSYTPVSKQKINVLCVFPVDGATNLRAEQGCGVSIKSVSNSDLCHRQGIDTAQKWYDKRVADGFSNTSQCGFNVKSDAREKAVTSFNESIKAMNLDAVRSFDQQNEMRLATAAWNSDRPGELPIKAFFYLSGGLADAQYDQKDYFATTQIVVPVIALTLPRSPSDDATFAFNEGDQAVKPSTAGDNIDHAVWINRYDPGVKRNEWTLSMFLTDKGRAAKSYDTDAVYEEMRRKYGDDPRWVYHDGGGMRRQLVCHYVIAREKEEWNLEPFRPDVPHDIAVAAKCNPT